MTAVVYLITSVSEMFLRTVNEVLMGTPISCRRLEMNFNV